jgi:RND family efflux transporter MFP subunit
MGTKIKTKKIGIICGALLFVTQSIIAADVHESPVNGKRKIQIFSGISKAIAYTAPARTISLRKTTLSATMDGIIEKISYRPGDPIKEGKALIKFNCQRNNLILEQEKNNIIRTGLLVEAAKKVYLRQKKLIKRKLISENTYIKSVENFDIAKVDRQLQITKKKLAAEKISHCIISSPFNGQVISILANEGEYVTAGTPVMKVIQVEPLELTASLTSEELRQVKKAKAIFFKTTRHQIPIKIRTSIDLQDLKTGRQKIYFSFVNKYHFPIGKLGNIEWGSAERQIELKFLTRKNRVLGVYLVVNDKVIFKPISEQFDSNTYLISLPINSKVIVP